MAARKKIHGTSSPIKVTDHRAIENAVIVCRMEKICRRQTLDQQCGSQLARPLPMINSSAA